jgi:hypothetical protein
VLLVEFQGKVNRPSPMAVQSNFAESRSGAPADALCFRTNNERSWVVGVCFYSMVTRLSGGIGPCHRSLGFDTAGTFIANISGTLFIRYLGDS